MSQARILGAGGVLWRDAGRRELAVVHRPRHDDWCLPKGKLEAAETFEAAAVREVAEETGFAPRIVGYAGEMFYEPGGTPKTVLLFEMELVAGGTANPPDPGEVDVVAWLTPEAALERLTYERERDVLRRIGSRD